MNKFKAYPKIGQFRQIVKGVTTQSAYVGIDDDGEAIFDNTLPKPKIVFTGTVKTHGTNAGVNYNVESGSIQAQSRNNLLTGGKDNVGFALFVESKKDAFKSIFEKIIKTDNISDVIIFGEWIGKGIQSNVAVCELEKRFLIFDVILKVINSEDWVWIPNTIVASLSNPDNSIHNVYQSKTFEIEIDFEHPELSQNKLIELTEQIEKQCPVGLYFGVEGIGEGIVWKANVEKYGRLYFKVKGEKHSVTKVKKLASVDIEKVKSIAEFASNVVTENRLNQIFYKVFKEENPADMSRKQTGVFLKALMNDIIEEELDTLNGNNLEPKDIGRSVSKLGKEWFFKKVDMV